MEKLGEVSIKSLLLKIKALEETRDVTVVDRMAIILGTVPLKKIEKINITEKDVEKVKKMSEEIGLELTNEEIVLLSKSYRFLQSIDNVRELFLREPESKKLFYEQ